MVPNITRFYHEDFLAPRLTPKLENHPLSAALDCLFNIFAATLNNGDRFFIRNLRARQVLVTKTNLWEIVNNRENYTLRRDNWFNAKYFNLTTISIRLIHP